MCRVKAPYVPCGICQANRLNAILDQLDKLCDPKKLREFTAEEMIRQAFDLGKSVHITK